jgi:hypothetical protein
MFDSVDEIIRATENPRHRAILLNYRRHGLLEVSQRWPGSWILLDGREQVAGFCRPRPVGPVLATEPV